MSENMSTNESTKLTKKEVDKIWWTWFKYALTVFGYERLQAPGFKCYQYFKSIMVMIMKKWLLL